MFNVAMEQKPINHKGKVVSAESRRERDVWKSHMTYRSSLSTGFSRDGPFILGFINTLCSSNQLASPHLAAVKLGPARCTGGRHQQCIERREH